MMLTIINNVILMVGIAVHLMQFQIGINIVQHVSALTQQLQQPTLQLPLLEVVTQAGQVITIVMMLTIFKIVILMVGIAVHLMQFQIGINIVQHVNALTQQLPLQQPLQLPLLEVVVTQIGQVTTIVMMVTIIKNVILMVAIAVHLMHLQIGINIV